METGPPYPGAGQNAEGSGIAQASHGGRAEVSITTIFRQAQPRPEDPAALAAAEALLSGLPVDGAPPAQGGLSSPHVMPWRPNPLFTGREPDLTTLARRIKAAGSAAVGQSPAVTGLGGQGKTQLAVEFAYRYGRWFKGGVFFVNCADAATMTDSVAACAAALYPEAGISALPLPEKVARVGAAWAGSMPRLLIFDNCEDEALLDAWVPRGGGCRLLVTARRSTWSAAGGLAVLPLGRLTRPESRLLLHRYRPDLPPEDPGLDAIAEELGDLPLALELAGRYLARARYEAQGTPAAYLTALRRPDLLDHASLRISDPDAPGPARSPTGHELDVARTFAVSLDRLRPDHPADALARQLLACAAWLAPGLPIPRVLLKACAGIKADDAEAGLRFSDALGRLLDLALAERADPADGGVALHRLVAAFAQTRLDPDATVRTSVEDLVAALADHMLAQDDPTAFRAWAGHLESVAAAAARDGTQAAIRLLNAAGSYSRLVADYAVSAALLAEAVERGEAAHGPDHPQVARTLGNLGIVQRQLRDLAAAQVSQTRALAIEEAAYGPDHPEVAGTLGNLGIVQRERGDLAAAQASQTRALAIFEAAYGPDHPEVAITLGNLGTVQQQRGDLAAAQASQTRALAIKEAAYGPDHPEVARTLTNLGNVQKERGDLAAAQASQTRALAIKEAAYGPDHPEVAITLTNLGNVQRERGDLAAAQASQTRALAIKEAAYGPDHSAVAITLGNLGTVQRSLGLIAEARHSYARALATFSTRLGDAHPHTLQARRLLSELDRPAEEGRPWWRRSWRHWSAASWRGPARWHRKVWRTLAGR